MGTPTSIHINLILPETRVLGYIFAADSMITVAELLVFTAILVFSVYRDAC